MKNPDGVMKGVKKLLVDGQEMEHIPVFVSGSEHNVEVIMG